MPEKDGDEAKSTKSVVNKKQKQMMNTEEFSDRQRSDMKNLLTKNFGDESTAKNTAIKVKASRAKEITGQSAVRDSQKYASGEYAKLGGGERMSLKMKGGGAATAGANPTKTGGPKENPKSLGGKSKGNTPVKVDVKKKIDMGKYFGGLGEKIDPLNFGKSKRTPEQKQQARAQKQRTDAVFNTKKGLGDMKTGTQSSEFLKTQKDVKKKPEDSQPLDEEGYDIARDMGKVRPSKDKKDATTMPPSKEMEKTRKVVKGPSALERVKKKYKGQIMKVEELDLTKVAEAFGGYIIEQDDSKEYLKKLQQMYDRSRNLEDNSRATDVKTGENILDKIERLTGYKIGDRNNPYRETSEKIGNKKRSKTTSFKNPGEEEIKKITPPEKKKKVEVTQSKSDALRGDKVTYGQPDEVKPKQGRLSKIATAAAANPAAALVAYDLGKGIIGKISKLRAPAVVGGKAGFRSAGGYQAT